MTIQLLDTGQLLETGLRATLHIGRSARRLLADRRGVAAIEFAFIAPVLLSLYFVTMEVSQGIEVNKKVGRVGSMVADLITQQQAISTTEIDAIMQIGSSILQPYNRSRPTITVTAIQVSDEDSPKATIAWSRKLSNGTIGKGAKTGDPVNIPASLITRNTFLIRVESELAYKPVITWTANQKQALGLAAAFDGIEMKEQYFLRPRISSAIGCTGC